MKLLSTMLAAAFVAGSCTVAMAQAGGGGGTGGGGSGASDSTHQGTMKDADKNPSAPGANPSAGNTGASGTRAGTAPGMAPASGGGMQTAPASNTRSDSPMKPATGNDATGAKTGQGGSK